MPGRAWPKPWTITVALATLLLGAAARADDPIRLVIPPKVVVAPGTAAEKAALAQEDTTSPVLASDLAQTPSDRFAGKPIVRVETTTVGDLWPSQPHVTKVTIGEPWSAEAARRATREMLDTGRFARAGVEVYPEGDGVVLRLALLPRRVIASISIVGGALPRSDTLDAAQLSEGGEVTATAIEVARSKIEKLYERRGFPSAVVHVDATDTDDPDKAVVSIDIEPGEPLVITSRTVTIDKVMFAEVGKLRNKYKIDPSRDVFEEIVRKIPLLAMIPIALTGPQSGVRADEPTLLDADRDLADLLKKSGFPRADVKHKVVKKGGHAELQVTIYAGPRLVPTFDGNRSFDADQLAAAVGLDKGEVSRASDAADRLRDFYVKRGFLDAEIEAKEEGGSSDAIHYLAFRIRENQRVRVTSRSFPCLTGELSASDIEGEIDTFLEEDVPRTDGFSPGDPASIAAAFGPGTSGTRARPPDIEPRTTYYASSYDRALKHIQDLYYSKGYLNAIVGPVSLRRAACDPKKSGEACVAATIPARKPACAVDVLGLPVPEPALPADERCVPDPKHHVECASEMTVVLPIHPGPRSVLYDVAFEGNRQMTEKNLAHIADLKLGDPLSSTEIEAARQRVLDYYLKRGYAYAEVRVNLEPSPDRTRARAKFTIAEHEVVIVTGFVVKGAKRTDEDLILGRVALVRGLPYRQDAARVSEERIAQLGTFTSVALSLEDPDVPQRNKRVVVTVVEQLPQYLDPRVGFSTGEGVRFAFEYGHRNLGGRAISGALRLQLAYLPDFLIPPSLLPAYQEAPLNNIAYRLERRNALTITFPDVGLGPTVTAAIDIIDLRDLQRDYALGREALVPSMTWRPRRNLSIVGSVSAEYNDVYIFNPAATPTTLKLIKVPEGQTAAFSQRVGATFDLRNNAFAPTRGALFAGSVEHVNALPTTASTTATNIGASQFLKMSAKVSAYVPLYLDEVSIAGSVSAGYNWLFQGQTYPDRSFFLGGVDSIRSYSPESVVPQDVASCIVGESSQKSCFKSNGARITIDDVPIRGGDLMMNGRLELRFPLKISSSLQGGLFIDAGNLWRSTDDFHFRLRTGLGFGLRIATPIGPIALDYGFNLRRYRWEEVGAFNFSIGLF
ncbi:MAG: POTRA domain-containing protein [Polyangiaceae bacterium]